MAEAQKTNAGRQVVAKLHLSGLVLLAVVGLVGFISQVVIVAHDCGLLWSLDRKKSSLVTAILERSDFASQTVHTKPGATTLTKDEVQDLMLLLPEEDWASLPPSAQEIMSEFKKGQTISSAEIIDRDEKFFDALRSRLHSKFWGDSDYRNRPWRHLMLSLFWLLPWLLWAGLGKWVRWLVK